VVDRNRCEAEEQCVQVCPYNVFEIRTLAPEQRSALSLLGRLKAWAHLKGVMVQGRAALIGTGPRFRKVRALLYAKYPQYPADAALDESDSVIVESPSRVFSWGMK
jgi:NAD-dependent dihydropyrimidine dehydrogenase PreA subunit